MAKANFSDPEGLTLGKVQFPSDDSEPTRLANAIIINIRDDLNNLPEALLELLTKVIKPLFSGGHPRVTPAGRKLAYTSPPTLPHSLPTSIHEEPSWRLPLTAPLLRWILKAYRSLCQPQRRQVLEAQFPFLVPPILNLIDDVPSSSRADGFSLLQLLCDTIAYAESDILKRTGLIDVCFDAIKSNFMLLPTLTSEEESIQVLKQLYPAALALIRARFSVTPGKPMDKLGKIPPQNSVLLDEEDQRQKYLKIILRHGLLASLTHLGVGSSISHVSLTTLLLSQLTLTVKAMGLAAVALLNHLIPMLRSILIDPFALSVPDLLLTALDAMGTMIKTCSPRIKDIWWSECLYGVVGCWCNILDDEEDTKKQPTLILVKDRVRAITQTLSETVDAEEWQKAVTALCREDKDMERLFNPARQHE
ncbi:hypothetical protein DV736_g6323, partial [Chaetothyriales sp. CBS 134916]